MSARQVSIALALLGAVLGLVAWSRGGVSETARLEEALASATVLSEVYTVDRKYRSMMGPYGEQEIFLGPEGAAVEEGELLWITGYRAVMVGADGKTPESQEFMCHSNLDIDADALTSALGVENFSYSPRLFTLSQGQLEVEFPTGFGIPVRSDIPLELTTQVLNLNLEGESREVRHKVTVQYVRETDVPDLMRPLFPTSAYGLKLIDGEAGYFGVEQPEEEDHGPGCLVGRNASDHEYEDGLGRTFSGHWVVEPGREENRTLVTHLMRVPYDTHIHYVAVHLHPFAESLELRDLTTGETVFKSRARNFEQGIGLRHVDYLSSVEGIPVYRDHEYELVSVYDNTTEEEQDSMAVMYIYLRDLEMEEALAKKRRRGQLG